MDSVIGLPVAQLLAELATDVDGQLGVQVVVISRKTEKHEQAMMHQLLDAGFVELTSHPLNEGEARAALSEIGIPDPSPTLVSMACNLLNLELIARIKIEQRAVDFAKLTDEADLWERYFAALTDREDAGLGFETAEMVISEARKLAWIGLRNDEGVFVLDDPMPHHVRRLVSWDIVQAVDGQVYRFRHEKVQDFLCAWDAVEKHWMPGQVLAETRPHLSRGVLTWMDQLYLRRSRELRKQFLREVFNV